MERPSSYGNLSRRSGVSVESLSPTRHRYNVLDDPYTYDPIQRLTPMELKRITLDFKQFSNKMDIMTKRSFFEYFRIEELYNTLIGDQIYKYFAEKSVIDYNKFLSKIAILAKGSIEERIKLIFDIYDINGSGVLDQDNLKRVLLSLINSMLDCETDNETLGGLQYDVRSMTPQQREQAVEDILNDMLSIQTASSLSFDDFQAWLTGKVTIRHSIEL